jgi:hypothetical protein
MEGNYAKIQTSVATLSKQGNYYEVFLANLMDTMRRRIVEALQKSSNQVSASLAVKMMYMQSVAELDAFVKKLQEEGDDAMDGGDAARGYANWQIRGDVLQFAEVQEVPSVNPYETIQNTIGYATEIERIV